MSPTAVTFLLDTQPTVDLVLPDDIPSQIVAQALAEKWWGEQAARQIWALKVRERTSPATRALSPVASLTEEGVLNGDFCVLEAQPPGEGTAALLVTAMGVRVLLGDETVLGRNEPGRPNPVDLDLMPLAAEKVISRRHAVITRQGANFTLEDCSKHGVWVNGNKIGQAHLLRSGDFVQFGPPERGAALTFEYLYPLSKTG